MIVLSYGYRQPQNGDRGSVWFPALNFDIQRLNDHSHDGVDSAFLSSSSIANAKVPLLAVNWVADGTGRYKQQGTVPVNYNMDDFTITVRIVTGDIVLASIQRDSNILFTVYTLDNTLDYEAVFS